MDSLYIYGVRQPAGEHPNIPSFDRLTIPDEVQHSGVRKHVSGFRPGIPRGQETEGRELIIIDLAHGARLRAYDAAVERLYCTPTPSNLAPLLKLIFAI